MYRYVRRPNNQALLRNMPDIKLLTVKSDKDIIITAFT